MGLDNYWISFGNVKQPIFKPELSLTGGLFSSNGRGSFRGKKYSFIVEFATNNRYTLYQNLSSEDVQDIDIYLDNLHYKNDWGVFEDYKEDITEQEFLDFKRMWKKYSEKGFGLQCWY